MKYDERFLSLSTEACDIAPKNDKEEDLTKVKQDLLLILLERFQEELQRIKDDKKPARSIGEGLITIKFRDPFYEKSDPGYYEIHKLLCSGEFRSFAREYCMYLGDIETRQDEYRDSYYEVSWDYKTYFEGLNNQNNMTVPYPVGSYVVTEQDGETRIDKVHQYIYDKNGLGVVLELDTFENPRLSYLIRADRFLANWKPYNNQQLKLTK